MKPIWMLIAAYAGIAIVLLLFYGTIIVAAVWLIVKVLRVLGVLS